MKQSEVGALAEWLISAYDNAAQIPSLSANDDSFDVDAAYAVLAEIERRRIDQGWLPVGRKIGFTNRTIWERYGVHQPMWARMWSHTVQFAPDNRALLALMGLVQPRIEPEVVFKLREPIPDSRDAVAILHCVEWMAAGFEIVQSHFPNWKFSAADCTAAFGLHGALVVGQPTPIDDTNRQAIAAALPAFALTLRRGDKIIETGIGANVLDSPALALAHLAHLLARQPGMPPLEAGELITTGTLTDAWPVRAGETWTSDYDGLGIRGLELTLL